MKTLIAAFLLFPFYARADETIVCTKSDGKTVTFILKALGKCEVKELTSSGKIVKSSLSNKDCRGFIEAYKKMGQSCE